MTELQNKNRLITAECWLLAAKALKMAEKDINLNNWNSENKFLEYTCKWREIPVDIEKLFSLINLDQKEYPSTEDEFLRIYGRMLERMIFNKWESKKKWSSEENMLFVWIVAKISGLFGTKLGELPDEAWNELSIIFCKRDSIDLLFKWANLQKSNIQNDYWTNEEDNLLVTIYNDCPKKNKWNTIAKRLFKMSANHVLRLGKHCRERWKNYLDPCLNKKEWSNEEDIILLENVMREGHHWSKIGKFIKGRTSNSIKNRYFKLQTFLNIPKYDEGNTEQLALCHDKIRLILNLLRRKQEKIRLGKLSSSLSSTSDEEDNAPFLKVEQDSNSAKLEEITVKNYEVFKLQPGERQRTCTDSPHSGRNILDQYMERAENNLDMEAQQSTMDSLAQTAQKRRPQQMAYTPQSAIQSNSSPYYSNYASNYPFQSFQMNGLHNESERTSPQHMYHPSQMRVNAEPRRPLHHNQHHHPFQQAQRMMQESEPLTKRTKLEEDYMIRPGYSANYQYNNQQYPNYGPPQYMRPPMAMNHQAPIPSMNNQGMVRHNNYYNYHHGYAGQQYQGIPMDVNHHSYY